MHARQRYHKNHSCNDAAEVIEAFLGVTRDGSLNFVSARMGDDGIDGTEDDEIITIIYGEDTDKEEAERLVSFIEENFEEVEVELQECNQLILMM